MDRSAQIVGLVGFLLFSFGSYAQKPVKQGVKASAFYFLQGIELEADSNNSQYSWVGPYDRAYVLGVDTTWSPTDPMESRSLSVKALSDSLITAPNITASDSLMKPEILLQDSFPLSQALDTLIDSASFDSIPLAMSDSILVDKEFIMPDSLSFDLLPETMGVAPEDSIIQTEVPVPPQLDSARVIISSIDSITISRDIVDEVQESPNEPVEPESEKNEVWIRSNLDLLGKQEPFQSPLDTLASRRRLLDNPRSETTRILEQKEVTQPIIMPTETKIIERTIDQSSSYTGKYAGLSQAERERQLRLDAENARKLALENNVHVPEGQQVATDQPADQTSKDVGTPSDETQTPSSNSSENTFPVPVVVPPSTPREETVVIVQRDTVTEKAVQKMGQRLDALSKKDSLATLRIEGQMKDGQENVEKRFNRIESKIDTLINALGQLTTMDKTQFKESSKDMDVYFAVNSHFITQEQREGLSQYLDEAKGKGLFKVVLSGYADNSGDASYNKMLVEKRIGAVKKAIEEMGINPTEILINNYGKQRADRNKTYNPSDRRVTIQLYSEE